MGTMKFTSKPRNSERWGMGFLLVFFPEEEVVGEEDEDDGQNRSQHKVNDLNFISSPSSSPARRASANYSSSNLLQKAQSTISICLLILFATMLLFTLSTLPSGSAAAAAPSRRRLRESTPAPSNLPRALQGMGTLYRRGTRAMDDVVLAHASESLSSNELKLFVRVFLRSALAAKSDLVLVLPSKTAHLDGSILRETKSFVELLDRYRSSNGSSFSGSGFTHFTRKLGKKEKENTEPIWGQKPRTGHIEKPEPDSNRSSYGSVVGFDVDELDPENSLSGFLDHVPMSLRRWACYPMLLGRVRRNFKHVVLVDMKEFLLLGDPLNRVRTGSPESVLLRSSAGQSNPGKHGKRNSDKTHPGIVTGGSRGVRRLSSAMLMEVVRASMIQRKKRKNPPVTESGIFNQLVGNEYALKNVNLIVSTDSLPEVSSLGGSITKSGSRNSGLIRRGSSHSNVVYSTVMKHICSFPIDAAVYSDCM